MLILRYEDGYLNEQGTLNLRRLQVVLDEMVVWEQEVFEKEYADMNWYKGKQTKYTKEMEMARLRSKLGVFGFRHASRGCPLVN